MDKKQKPYSIYFRNDNPVDARLVELLDNKSLIQFGECDYAAGQEMLRKLILIGCREVEKLYPGQIVKREGATKTEAKLKYKKDKEVFGGIEEI